MTADEIIEFMQTTVAALAMDPSPDRRAILGDLSPEHLGAVQQFLASFTDAALHGRTS